MPDTINSLVERNRAEIVKRLPSYLSEAQFFQLCKELDRDRKITAVAQRNPDSVLSCIFKAADCGLTIGGPFGHCFLAPFGEEVVFMIGWKGFVYQWLRAGALIKVVSNVVYDSDYIDLGFGDEEKIEHRPNITDKRRDDPKWMADKNNIVGSYAIGWLPDAHIKVYRYVTRGNIERARQRSSNATGPAWTHSYPEMAAKTAVRRLDGLVQICGPTKENREAWDRYGRTVVLDREQFDRAPEEEKPDDLPGATTDRPSPKSGATVERGTNPGSPKDTATTSESRPKKGSAASPPPPKEPEQGGFFHREDPAEETIPEEMQAELQKQADHAGMSTSKLMAYIRDTYHVKDLSELTKSQSEELQAELRKRAAER